MAVFRVEKNRGYTVMSNHHLRNKALSLKAKGLLSQMYHNADRRRTIGKITAAMPGMDGDMWTLAQQTPGAAAMWPLASGVFSFCLFLRI